MNALETSRILLVPQERFRALVERHPGVAAAVIRLLAERLRALTLMVVTSLCGDHVGSGREDVRD